MLYVVAEELRTIGRHATDAVIGYNTGVGLKLISRTYADEAMK